MTKRISGYGKSVFPQVRKRLKLKKARRLRRKRAKKVRFLAQRSINLYPFRK